MVTGKTTTAMNPPTPELCVAILGPTCSGKSDVAMAVAESIGGEIISCDSMQIYRGMTIGTAAPISADARRIPHHLVGELDIDQPYDAHRFMLKARRVLAKLAGRRKPAVLVGGTGMYAKALIYGYRMYPSDPTVFAAVSRECAEDNGPNRLREELQRHADNVSPDTLGNPRRLVRAVEILRLTGEVPGATAAARSKRPAPPWLQFILLPAADRQRACIEQRTDRMLKAGWIDEVRALIGQNFLHSPTARQALGYADIAQWIEADSPVSGLQAVRDTIVRATVRYARRQRTWFRRQHPGAFHLPLRRAVTAVDIAAAILAELPRHYSGASR